MSAVLDWGSDFDPTKMRIGGAVEPRAHRVSLQA